MDSNTGVCPKCSDETWREEVDIGLGVIHGPFGCSSCGWSEDPRYDSSEGRRIEGDFELDPHGGMTRIKNFYEPPKE